MVSLSSLKGKVWSGYLLAFLLLLISYFLIFYTIRRSISETKTVTHTFTVINNLEELKVEVTEAETGLRGYVITGDIRFLEPYTNAVQHIPPSFDTLRSLTADNEEQQNRLDTLADLVKKKLEYMASGLAGFRAHGYITDSMKLHREASKQTMDNIRLLISRMEVREEQLMEIRKNKLAGFFSSTQIIAIISLVIAFITLFYSLIVFNKENKEKLKAIEKATHYSIELEANIRELKNTNLELQEFKSVEKFTATGRIARTIAHEVRNPLTNISLAAEQLQETVPNQETSLLLDMIIRNAGRINQLVSELLNATRFAHLEFQKIPVNRLLEETLELAKDRIKLNNIQVEKHFTEELCLVNVDGEKIKFGLLNIVVNAIEAMEKDKGVLTLKTKKQGDKCIIEIRDNGKGMNEDVLQNLFEPYFTGKLKGNGLGLTNTQNVILNHKGSIKVYSKPEQGATFLIALNLDEN